MMEKLVLVFCALFGLSLGFVQDLDTLMQGGTPVKPQGDAPRPCCGPTQFEGMMSELDSFLHKGGIFHHDKAGIVAEQIAISYDGDNQKIAMDQYVEMSGNHTFHQRLILDFQQKEMYIIRHDKCVSKKLRGTFKPNCLPDNSTHLGQYYLGSGDNKLSADSWKVVYPFGHDEGIVLFVSTAADNCMFISEAHMGKMKKASFFGVLSLVNPTLGIKDPSVFTPPSSCQPGEVSVDNEMMMRLIDRFMN